MFMLQLGPSASAVHRQELHDIRWTKNLLKTSYEREDPAQTGTNSNYDKNTRPGSVRIQPRSSILRNAHVPDAGDTYTSNHDARTTPAVYECVCV
jgi:hypothetical protein